MEHVLQRRALSASIGSAWITGPVALLLGGFMLDWLSLLSLTVGILVLGLAQLARTFAVLRRGPASRRSPLARFRSTVLCIASVALTVVAVALLTAGLGGADDDASSYGAVL